MQNRNALESVAQVMNRYPLLHLEVHVTVEDSHFFSVEVDGAPWLVDAVNGDAGAEFLAALNAQASAFEARLVVSHAAVRVDAAVAPARPPISPPARAAVATATNGSSGAP